MSAQAVSTSTHPPAASVAAAQASAPSGLDVAALFGTHGAWVHRVAQRMTGSAPLADDVVQEVFVLLHRRRHEIDERIGIRT